MTGKSQPKLFKMVCKRAGLMRAPYRGSPWPTSQINKTDKKNKNKNKPLLVNETQEKHQSNVAELNVEQTCSSIEKVSIIKKHILYPGILFN